MISIDTQASTLRSLLERMTAHGLKRSDIVASTKEGELAIEHLRASLQFLEIMIRNRDKAA